MTRVSELFIVPRKPEGPFGPVWFCMGRIAWAYEMKKKRIWNRGMNPDRKWIWEMN